MIKIFTFLTLLACALSDPSLWKTPDEILNDPEIAEDDTYVEKIAGGVEMHLVKSPEGHIQMLWSKGENSIYLQKVVGKELHQDWNFGNVHINVSYEEGGDLKKVWNFGPTKLTYIRKADGEEIATWENGNEDAASLQKYQEYITEWCAENGVLFDGENCDV